MISTKFNGIVFLIATGIGCWLTTSCTRSVKIEVPSLANKLVVNCLFNPDSSWSVYVGQATRLSDSSGPKPLNTASVQIFEKGVPFSLTNVGEGKYTTDAKPLVGIPYKIEVHVLGYPLISATGNIPEACIITSTSFDTTATYFVPDNSFDNVKVNRAGIMFQLTDSDNQFYQLLGFSYNIDPYCDFIITDKTLENLHLYRTPDFLGGDSIPAGYIQKLSIHLKDISLKGKNYFLSQVKNYTGTGHWNNVVYEFAQKIRHSPSVYDSTNFEAAEIYSKGLHFYNITSDSHSVFGEYNQKHVSDKDSVTLFAKDIFDTGVNDYGVEINQQRELWLNIYSMSKAMFNYQTTYINQLINDQNPFARPVQVYSNIQNGLGIFAGYQVHRMKVY